MEVASIILVILSILAIASAIVTIVHKEPVKSALTLVFHFFMLAGIYLTLSAELLAVLQVMVYAGAIMVLVLFVIMLLNVSDEESAKMRKNQLQQSLAITASIALLVVIASYLVLANSNSDVSNSEDYSIALTNEAGSVYAISTELFTNYLVPLEIIGILLLATIIGAVLLAKKHLN